MSEKEEIVQVLREADRGTLTRHRSAMAELLFLDCFWRYMPPAPVPTPPHSVLSMEGRQALRALS